MLTNKILSNTRRYLEAIKVGQTPTMLSVSMEVAMPFVACYAGADLDEQMKFCQWCEKPLKNDEEGLCSEDMAMYIKDLQDTICEVCGEDMDSWPTCTTCI